MTATTMCPLEQPKVEIIDGNCKIYQLLFCKMNKNTLTAVSLTQIEITSNLLLPLDCAVRPEKTQEIGLCLYLYW